MGFLLKQKNIPFVILDENERVGDDAQNLAKIIQQKHSKRYC